MLSRSSELTDVRVTAVSAEPLWTTGLAAPGRAATTRSRRVARYLLGLADCSDPITFIGKRTTALETQVYQFLGERLTGVLPPARFIHEAADRSWLVLEDVPGNYPPSSWAAVDVEAIVNQLAAVHAAYWEEANEDAESLGLPHYHHGKTPDQNWAGLRRDYAFFLDEGPGAVLSDHAIRSAGRLSPYFLQAANGLVMMRDLGGWPGVLGESHLTAAADLLDDPLPLLNALDDLPLSLLHGAPHSYHWRSTLFGQHYLIDWSRASIGPGVLDLICFLEHFPLLYRLEHQVGSAREDYAPEHDSWDVAVHMRDLSPLTEETILDGYLLSMSALLGRRFQSRIVRQAIPAARCLHTLITWFPYFASWFGDMPNKYVWQRANRLSEAELANSRMGPAAGIRPYLAGVFERFLQAYRSL